MMKDDSNTVTVQAPPEPTPEEMLEKVGAYEMRSQIIYLDKLEKFGSGPWLQEADQITYVLHGFPCEVRRTDMGYLCGYISVPPGHPWWGVELVELDHTEIFIEVHGGVTHCGFDHGLPKYKEQHWWCVGFDCGHAGDISPKMFKLDRKDKGLDVHQHAMHHLATFLGQDTYKTVQYVMIEISKLVDQASHIYFDKK